jgi:uncharacterized SAM-binding protein YcdF (DUF218 family)
MTKALFELRKFLPVLVMPLGLSLLLIAFGLLLRRRVLAIAGLLLLFLASLPAVSDSLGLFLENQYPHLQVAQCPTADVVVPLGGYAGEMKRFPGEIQWNEAVDRFEVAVQLPTDDRHDPTGELVRQAAVEHGVPASAIRLSKPVTTTADEAEAVRDYLHQNGGHRVILVTSAIHMTRAAFLFRRAGIEFVPFPVDYESDGWQWKWDRFEPSADALARADHSVHEIYGNLLYRIMPFKSR